MIPSATDPVVVSLLQRCAFPATGCAVTCAVSGGPDSTALLALALAADLDVTAVHVDHGLRSTSGDEAVHVAGLAATWGARFVATTAPVADGPNLEERTRSVRHAALGPGALFGHTADDQAETVLLRLLRGTGPTGLAAMRPERHPLLALRRSETVDLCRHLGVEPLDDPSNGERRFTRNRVRHELIPQMVDVAGRDVVPLLARLAELSAQQVDLVGTLARDLDPTDAVVLSGAPRVLAAESFRGWWRVRTGAPPPDAAAVDRVLAVAAGDAKACDVVSGWRVWRSSGRLHLDRAHSATDGPCCEDSMPE